MVLVLGIVSAFFGALIGIGIYRLCKKRSFMAETNEPEIHTIRRFMDFSCEAKDAYNKLMNIFECNSDKFKLMELDIDTGLSDPHIYCRYRSFGDKWLVSMDFDRRGDPIVSAIANPAKPESSNERTVYAV